MGSGMLLMPGDAVTLFRRGERMAGAPTWEAVDLLLSIARNATRGMTYAARLDAIADPLLALIPGTSISSVVVHPEAGPRAAWFRNGDIDNSIEYGAHYQKVDPMWGP